MKIYRFHNGDLCPCCGQPLVGKTEEELEAFSVTVYRAGVWLGLADWIIRPEEDAIERSHEELMRMGGGELVC